MFSKQFSSIVFKEGGELYRERTFDMSSANGPGPVREPAGLLPGSDKSPSDVPIPIWSNGQDTALDVTAVTTLQAALVVYAITRLGCQPARNVDREDNDCIRYPPRLKRQLAVLLLRDNVADLSS